MRANGTQAAAKNVSKQVGRTLRQQIGNMNTTLLSFMNRLRYDSKDPDAVRNRETFKNSVFEVSKAQEKERQMVYDILEEVLNAVDEIFWACTNALGVNFEEVISKENSMKASKMWETLSMINVRDESAQIIEASIEAFGLDEEKEAPVPKEIRITPVLTSSDELKVFEAQEILKNAEDDGRFEGFLNAANEIESLRTGAPWNIQPLEKF
jgi:hypothetical protein